MALEGCGEVLPIFSFEEEAEMFLWFELPGTEWRVRETSVGELTSLLYGLCAGADKVALDPSPEIVSAAMVGIISLGRKDFLRNLLDVPRPEKPPQDLPPAMDSNDLVFV